jgi:crossover junction endodeoxyribonuclease RuvC
MGISPQEFTQLQQRLSGRSRKRPEAEAAAPAAAVQYRRVLGVDPSLRGTGYGVIELGSPGPVGLAHGTIRCPPGWERSRCLGQIAATLREVIRVHRPDVCAVEGLFHARNLRTALIMGEARGAALAAVAEARLGVYELAPRKVKLAIVGFGGAQKLAVAKMVQRMLALTEPPEADAADALATALAFAQERSRTGLGQPERV